MSIEALSWAFNLILPSSGAKLTLLALANYANEDGEAYPSQKSISEKTCLCDRAIRTHLVTLENLGAITRKSRTRVNGSFTSDLFKLNIGAVIADGKTSQRKILPTEENDSSQRQILPKPAEDSSYPESALKTTITKTNPKKKEKETPSAFVLPTWINRLHWEAWHSCQKRKKATDQQKAMAVQKLEKWKQQGIDHAKALEDAAIGGWAGLFEPRARDGPKSYAQQRDEERKNVADILTGRKSANEPQSANERDITGECFRVA